ncbi:MAG: hypothetical protein KC492_01190, partial [Myxococcales bacterium]|nr:hypothetical protein [Myxococcales bacterium]
MTREEEQIRAEDDQIVAALKVASGRLVTASELSLLTGTSDVTIRKRLRRLPPAVRHPSKWWPSDAERC